MEQIITGKEKLIPTQQAQQNGWFGGMPQNGWFGAAGMQQRAVAAAPVQQAPEAISPMFWNAIHKIPWNDKGDGANPTRPSQLLKIAEFRTIQAEIIVAVTILIGALNSVNFFQLYFNESQKRKDQFIHHIISKGKQIFDGVVADPVSAIGYIDQDCGFMEFLAVWS
jgi:hypothetical protein